MDNEKMMTTGETFCPCPQKNSTPQNVSLSGKLTSPERLPSDQKDTYVMTLQEGQVLSFLINAAGETWQIHADALRQSGESVGDVYAARVEKVMPSLGAAFIRYAAGKIGYLQLDTCRNAVFLHRSRKNEIRPDDELIVQLIKPVAPPKRPVFSGQVEIAGSYAVVGFSGQKSEAPDGGQKCDSRGHSDGSSGGNDGESFDGNNGGNSDGNNGGNSDGNDGGSFDGNIDGPPRGNSSGSCSWEACCEISVSRKLDSEVRAHLRNLVREHMCTAQQEQVEEHMRTEQREQAGKHMRTEQRGQAGEVMNSVQQEHAEECMSSGQTAGRKERSLHIVIRTNAAAAGEDEVLTEIMNLREALVSMCRRAEHQQVPCPLRTSHAVWLERLRALRAERIGKIVTEEALFETAGEYLEENLPQLKPMLSCHHDPMISLRALFSLDSRLEKALAKKVWLRSGGFLVIEQTEALVSIDVNSGKGSSADRKLSKEQQYLRTNLEAAQEIARQVRIRSLGGIIIADFINMQEESSRAQVLECLARALESDPAGCSRPDFTRLGLVEFTRRKIENPLGTSGTGRARGTVPMELPSH